MSFHGDGDAMEWIKKNGKLLAACVTNNFDILLTIDKNLMYQQNLEKYELSIVVLNSTTSKIEELVHFIPSLKRQVNNLASNGIKKLSLIRVSKIATLDKSLALGKIGSIDTSKINELNCKLKQFLQLT